MACCVSLGTVTFTTAPKEQIQYLRIHQASAISLHIFSNHPLRPHA